MDFWWKFYFANPLKQLSSYQGVWALFGWGFPLCRNWRRPRSAKTKVMSPTSASISPCVFGRSSWKGEDCPKTNTKHQWGMLYWYVGVCIYIYTWKPNDLYLFEVHPRQNKAFSNQNKCHLGSRYMYYVYKEICTRTLRDVKQGGWLFISGVGTHIEIQQAMRFWTVIKPKKNTKINGGDVFKVRLENCWFI